jgi:hypothetical protein
VAWRRSQRCRGRHRRLGDESAADTATPHSLSLLIRHTALNPGGFHNKDTAADLLLPAN